MSEENFFEKFGLEVKSDIPILGKTYMVYGMVTNILQETPETILEINFNVRAKLQDIDSAQLNTIRERVFEPGMFNCKFLSLDEKTGIYDVLCTTVIFGRKQELNEQ